MKKGDVVIVHNDIPCTAWKMAVIKDLIMGEDGFVCAATIRTTTVVTNIPITKLYPLELNATYEMGLEVKKSPTVPLSDPVDSGVENSRTQRSSARRATAQIREWVRTLSVPQRMLQRTNYRTLLCNSIVCACLYT